MGGQLTEKECIETAWRIHAAISDWTTKADAKATFALTVETALLGLAVAFAGSGHLSGAQGALVALGAATMIFAISSSALVVYPTLRRKALAAEAPANFIYFGHIKHMTEDQLFTHLCGDNLLRVLTHQVKITADIAWTKHRKIQTSLIAAALGAGLTGMAVLVG
jgi:hypothetical protein